MPIAFQRMFRADNLLLWFRFAIAVVLVLGVSACDQSAAPTLENKDSYEFDVLIRNAGIYDGTGEMPYSGDIGIKGDKIVLLGDAVKGKARKEIDASGYIVAPGFINAQSRAADVMALEGVALNDLMQGVTTNVLGEGQAIGTLNPLMQEAEEKRIKALGQDQNWNSLTEYFSLLESNGIALNVAALVNANTIRENVMGQGSAQPTVQELELMKSLLAQGMDEGAVGMSAALIGIPGGFFGQEELIALNAVVAEYKGVFGVHLRSYTDGILPALDEIIEIAQAAKIDAHIFHIRVGGEHNWPKMQAVVERINQQRDAGLNITASMNPYTSTSSTLHLALPPWSRIGSVDEWIPKLSDPQTRAAVLVEMRAKKPAWENLFWQVSSPSKVVLLRLLKEQNKKLVGYSLQDLAELRGTTVEDAVIDLIIEDHSQIGVAIYLASEENVQLALLPEWVSIGTDGAQTLQNDLMSRFSSHPRAYGSFAKYLSHYVRQERKLSLRKAIQKITQLPARVFNLKQRGCLETGCFADIVIFDILAMEQLATIQNPNRLSAGVQHLFVNGVQVIESGHYTGAKPGQVLRGAGFRKKAN